MIKTIKNYISKDLVSYAHINELLTRENKIIYASENGFIIYDVKCNFTYISFSNIDEMKEVLGKNHYEHYQAYDKEIVDFFNDEGKTINLLTYAYTKKDKFNISNYDIRKLDLNYIDIVNENYKAIAPSEDNSKALLSGEVIGLFVDNNLAGLIGRHPEGCMGMLKVFEKYRRNGYGETLEKAKINDLLERNIPVFCEVVEGNYASILLQEKLGLTKGNKKIYWKL